MYYVRHTNDGKTKGRDQIFGKNNFPNEIAWSYN
jgi:hypothetical protein